MRILTNLMIAVVLSFAAADLAALPSSSSTVPSASKMAPSKDPNALIGNELSRLDDLIQATVHSLEGQKKLRERIIEYHKIQDAYFLHPDDNELLFRMIKSAYRTLEGIESAHLIHTFDPDFISELTVLSQVASKRGIPKP